MFLAVTKSLSRLILEDEVFDCLELLKFNDLFVFRFRYQACVNQASNSMPYTLFHNKFTYKLVNLYYTSLCVILYKPRIEGIYQLNGGIGLRSVVQMMFATDVGRIHKLSP